MHDELCINTEYTEKSCHVEKSTYRSAEQSNLLTEAHNVGPFKINTPIRTFFYSADESKTLNVPQSQSKIINFSGIACNVNNVEAVCWP